MSRVPLRSIVGPPRPRLRLGMVTAVIAAVILPLSACSGGFSAATTCEASGNRWIAGTCTHQLTPEQLARRQWCESHGRVYLAGDDVCAFSGGGP